MKTKISIIVAVIFLLLASKNLFSDTFIVINTNDSGNGSLREAMTMANDSAGIDTINFNIAGTGPHTIQPNSQLPSLNDPAGVFINGLSQPGASAGTNPPATAVLMIEVQGFSAGAAHGFNIQSPNNTIQGLVINGFMMNGISIPAIAGGSYNNYIFSNFIGTDPSGTLGVGNGLSLASFYAGVYIFAPLNPPPTYSAYNNTIEGNLISYNYTEGVSMASCPPGEVYNNSVIENYIGTDITGKNDLGNEHDGVYIGEKAHDNLVARNLISANRYSAVGIMGYWDPEIQWITYNNQITENIIGLTIDYKPLPNKREGVSIGQYGPTGIWGYTTDNIIGPDNIIAYNGRNGILIREHGSSSINTDRNRITQNSIYANTLLGIDLEDDGITPNDLLDNDAGANQWLNFPVIDTAFCSSGQTTIRGTIDIDTNPSQAVVEIFKVKSDTIDTQGYGEGMDYIDTATPDNAGNWSVVVTGLNVGDTLTATTTDNTLNTSEFCKNIVIRGLPVNIDNNTPQYPNEFQLSQNFPNPFNSTTVISYQLPQNSEVELKIFNLQGKLVKTLIADNLKAGEHTVFWNGLDKEGNSVPSGVYFYRIKAGSYIAIRKALLIK